MNANQDRVKMVERVTKNFNQIITDVSALSDMRDTTVKQVKSCCNHVVAYSSLLNL